MKKKYTAKEARNLILDTASLLFIEKGYEQTSISDIVTGLTGSHAGLFTTILNPNITLLSESQKGLYRNRSY